MRRWYDFTNKPELLDGVEDSASDTEYRTYVQMPDKTTPMERLAIARKLFNGEYDIVGVIFTKKYWQPPPMIYDFMSSFLRRNDERRDEEQETIFEVDFFPLPIDFVYGT